MAREERYGLTPWGAWFLEAVKRYDENGRLSRGRGYANTGRVAEIEVKGCEVLAKVEGRSRPFYRVKIAFPPFTVRDKKRLIGIISSNPLWAARIEAGDIPVALIAALKSAGLELTPRRWTEMKRSCSCPDWGDPCKHMAAVYFLLTREIDRNPFTLFSLRGLDLAACTGLRDDRTVETILIPTQTDESPQAPAEEPDLRPPENYAAFIPALLAPKPSFAVGDFKISLVEFYHASARAAARLCEVAWPDSDLAAAILPRLPEAEIVCSVSNSLAAVSFRIRHPGLDLARSKPAYSGLEMMRLLLASGDPAGTPTYRYLFYLARAAYFIIKACAFVPAVRLEAGRMLVLWRPLPAASDVRQLLDETARYAPALLRSKPDARKHWDGRSTTEALLVALLCEYVRELSFIPSKASAHDQALLKLVFHGVGLDVSRFSERSLPRAVDAWLAAFSLVRGEFGYSFRIEAESENDRAYRLSLEVRKNDAAAALFQARQIFGSAAPLRFPAALAQFLPEIMQLSTQPSIQLGEERLGDFLSDAAPVLRRIGADVILPKELEKILKPRLVLTAQKKPGGLKSFLDAGSLLSFAWQVALGGRTISIDEFERLVGGKSGVVRFHDEWVRLDPGEAALLLERAGRHAPGLMEAVQARLAGEAAFSADVEALFGDLFRERTTALPAGLRAVLRPYQERGFRWVYSNLLNGFGCLLADDMGLGKTIQAIALMLALKNDGLLAENALVAAPATLLTNWERELERFAPGLSVRRYHRAGRRLDAPADVLLTTYETLARDAKTLSARNFSLVVLDEAHRIKNPAARQSRAAKSLRSAYRLALSGTPVENNLSELHSIFEFVLPGFLGTQAEFDRRFRRPIEIGRDAAAAERLRQASSPFLLRRLKTDKAVISDLPDKVSLDEYASLTREQAALYESVVREGLAQVEDAAKLIGRRARILKLITALKQICNHPRAYDRRSPALASLSGKCGLLLTLLAEMLERREKVLVFSQYVETIEILRLIIRDELGEQVLRYHGRLSQAERSRAVDEFQSSPARRIMLVSLRAGGVGLNLTAASRVIHYDLWFNPAVETQATDRAFRIGQTRDVFVHRFITAGTFEEKIDAMIRSKRELAELSVATGEKWLAGMTEGELKDLFDRR